MKAIIPYQNNEVALKTSSLVCRSCGSRNVYSKNIGQRTVTALGAGFGAVAGYYEQVDEGELSAIARAVLGAFSGAITGGLAGSALGKLIDEQILNNHECLDCYHQF